MGRFKFSRGSLTKRKQKDKKIENQEKARLEFNEKYPASPTKIIKFCDDL